MAKKKGIFGSLLGWDPEDNAENYDPDEDWETGENEDEDDYDSYYAVDPDGLEEVFDEDGNEIECPNFVCDGQLMWDPVKLVYVCPRCGSEFNRSELDL